MNKKEACDYLCDYLRYLYETLYKKKVSSFSFSYGIDDLRVG